MIVTDDEEAFVRMVFDQGAYEGLYERHGVKSDYFAQHLNRRPLSNMRMSNITAAIARAQLPYVGERIRKYAESYNLIRQGLSDCELIEFPPADEREVRVLDSIQFRLKGFRPEQMDAFIELARAEGLPLAAFSARDNARAPWNWLYLGRQPDLPLTRAALATACDMRLTSTLTAADCAFFVRAVLQAARAVAAHKDAVHAATDER
jgi:dTDP-4-amino-4,6-dideoxygalactose transaminase